MKEHLKWKHPADESLKESERPACKQAMLYVFTKSCICSPERSALISGLITQVIAKDLCPINLVNGRGFQQLFAYLK